MVRSQLVLPASRTAHLLVLTVLGVFAFLVNNGTFDATLMEARNFVTAREILQNDSWLIPTMNGELRLAKPPFPTWLSAVAGALVGSTDNLAAMRFPAGLVAVLMVLLAYGFTFSVTRNRQQAFVTAAVLATSGLMIQMGRNGTWDIFCHAFMLGAIWQLWQGWHRQGRAWREFVLAGLLAGLSFMSKGPVAFYAMLLPFLLSYFSMYRFDQLRGKGLGMLVALVICVGLSAWWPLYINAMVPEAAQATADAETTAWSQRHVKPFFHYIRFPVFIGLWLIPFAIALIRPWIVRHEETAERKQWLFALLWVGLTWLLLSVIPEKKDRYLLPIMVPMALAAGPHLATLTKRLNEQADGWSKAELWLHGGITGLATLALPFGYWLMRDELQSVPVWTWALVAPLFVAVGLAALWSVTKRNGGGVVLCNLALVVLVTGLVLPLGPALTYNNARFNSIAEARNVDAIQAMNWYSLGTFNLERVYAVGRVVEPWDPAKTTAPLQQLPIAVFSERPPQDYLSDEMKQQVAIEPIAVYYYHRTNENRQRYLSVFRAK